MQRDSSNSRENICKNLAEKQENEVILTRRITANLLLFLRFDKDKTNVITDMIF